MVKLKSKIKKGDEVIVISGKDKGRRGAVLRVLRSKEGRIRLWVEGANKVKKHVKPNPQANKPGGIQEIEAALDISKVMLFDETAQKRSRVGYRLLEDGSKVRYFKASGEVLEANKH